MNASYGINHQYLLDFQVLTPLHVGGPLEKHLKKDLDFLVQNQKLYLLDEQALLENLGHEELTEALLNGIQFNKFTQLLNQHHLRLEQVIKGKAIPIPVGEFSEIKTFIRDGLQGRPYLPGSSLKGAIRSIVFGHLAKREPRRFSNKASGSTLEKSALGGFSDSIFRHFKVGDISFEKTEFFPTKTFNLHSREKKWTGGWRHGKKNTNSQFNNYNGIFVHECLAPGVSGKLSLRMLDSKGALTQQMRTALYSNKDKEELKVKLPAIFDALVTPAGLTPWYDLINAHSRAYLQKEIAFFETYPVAETRQIIASLESILAILTDKPPTNWCIMRMAHGSGFHSITGDWQYPDTYTDPNDCHHGGINQGKKKYKSRKLAFRDSRFYPMGWIAWGEGVPANLLASIGPGTAVPEMAAPKVIEGPRFFSGKLKIGSELDAEVIVAGPPIMVRVYFQESVTREMQLLGYRNSLAKGSQLVVTVESLDKDGNVKSVKFKKLKL